MKSSFFIIFLVIQLLAVLCASQAFDFFYFVQQWPVSYCNTKRSCCNPNTGKPASDFGIHGLWPNYNNGRRPPSYCKPASRFNASKISDLKSRMQTEWPTLSCPSNRSNSVEKFWSHEWEKHGTCSESVLDQHDYFLSALTLKKKLNLLGILKKEGIEPNGTFYSLNNVSASIKTATGFTPDLECNVSVLGNNQLYQVYMCVNTSGTDFIQCPIFRRKTCNSSIEFPKF